MAPAGLASFRLGFGFVVVPPFGGDLGGRGGDEPMALSETYQGTSLLVGIYEEDSYARL